MTQARRDLQEARTRVCDRENEIERRQKAVEEEFGQMLLLMGADASGKKH